MTEVILVKVTQQERFLLPGRHQPRAEYVAYVPLHNLCEDNPMNCIKINNA